MPPSSHPDECNIRLLAGEIWAEVNMRALSGVDPPLPNDVTLLHTVLDVAMGVLARHVGETIRNDDGLPVPPLPPSPLSR
ncbi:hypothetical protein PLCT1_01668 [Planctomycetaceae bacterium]|nr:hypothetical protein PLCT1_01668 [Planctomycetaceae bacterium]